MFYSSIDDSVPALPPKREKRPVSSSGSIISNRSQNYWKSKFYIIFIITQEQDNDERIQLIVDDINHIIEKYTRELDDALHKKTTIRSPSTDYISQPNHSSLSSCRSQ